MNFNKIKIIIGREFAIRVKKKSFIVTTILTPILFAALMVVPSLIMLSDTEENTKVLVVDKSGLVASSLEDTQFIDYIISDNHDVDLLKSNFDSLGVDALAVVSALDENNNVSLTAYSNKQLNVDVKSSLSNTTSKAVENFKLTKYDIENLDEILTDVKTKVKVDNFIFGEDGKEKKSMVEVNMAISYVLAFLIYFFVLMFGNMVMRSVIDEKASRIVEVIVSSVKPFELMIGKIIGVACVAITQFLIWVVLTLVLVTGFSLAAGQNILASQEASQQMVEQVIGADSNAIAAITQEPEISGILSSLSQVDFPYIIGCFLIYFVLGYLLYAAMFAAVGSAVDNEADTQQLTMPITLPLILGLFIMLHTFKHPDSALSFWASIIPFTSPMVMLARIPFSGGVPLWELLLSIGLLLGTFLVVVYFSGKIYRVGILMYGKKASWKDLAKWLKY